MGAEAVVIETDMMGRLEVGLPVLVEGAGDGAKYTMSLTIDGDAHEDVRAYPRSWRRTEEERMGSAHHDFLGYANGEIFRDDRWILFPRDDLTRDGGRPAAEQVAEVIRRYCDDEYDPECVWTEDEEWVGYVEGADGDAAVEWFGADGKGDGSRMVVCPAYGHMTRDALEAAVRKGCDAAVGVAPEVAQPRARRDAALRGVTV